jgi:hypothetical protein
MFRIHCLLKTIAVVVIQFRQFVVHFESKPTALDAIRQKGGLQQVEVPGTVVVVLCRLVCYLIQIKPKTVARRGIEPILVVARLRALVEGKMEEDQVAEDVNHRSKWAKGGRWPLCATLCFHQARIYFHSN